MGWSKEQARNFARKVVKTHPNVWDWINAETRQALIDAECLSIVSGQHSETVRTDEITSLRREMHRAAGLIASEVA